MTVYRQEISALNAIIVAYGGAGSFRQTLAAYNEFSRLLGGASDHDQNVDALNEIVLLLGGSGEFQQTLDALNEVSRLLGGGSDYDLVIDALNVIVGLPVAGGGTITLSASSIAEDASIGSTVGILSVTGGSGSYNFTISSDPDNKFNIGSVTHLITDAALDYETATSHQVTIHADNGVDPVLSRTFTITVTDVVEAAGSALMIDFSSPSAEPWVFW